MTLRGGNLIWGNVTHSHDVCTAETSMYNKLKNKENVCVANKDNSTDEKVGGCNQQLF